MALRQFDEYASLVFFASAPNGDPVAFRVSEEHVNETAIVTMSHEDGMIREEAASLREYLSQLLKVAAA